MEPQKSRFITIMVVPESSGTEVRRLRFPRKWLVWGVSALAVLVVGSALSIAVAVAGMGRPDVSKLLRAENETLRGELERLDTRLTQVGRTVDRLKDYEQRLRSLTMVNDPSRNLAIGPVGADESEGFDPGHPAASEIRKALLTEGHVADSIELLDARLAHLEGQGSSVDARATELAEYLKDQRGRLASTPSRKPSAGYISSTFGMRVDPFTGLPQMHSGLDFAAAIGSRVMATADGVVVKARNNGAYGLTVQVDHGHGLSTLYGHMSRINVKAGDEVKRGDLIGAIGNTGRSTGPHLHYEVRLNGIAVDPRRFILE